MRVIVFIVISMASATMLAGCGVHGVDQYQGALRMGCKPVPTGVICAGDRG
jgi:hypothetical protein